MSRPDHAGFCNKEHQPGTTPCARIVPTPAEGQLVPHARDLAALPDGERVKDVVGDVWEKRDGWWYCLDSALRGEQLLTVWGPVTRTQEPAIVRYGEDQG